MHETYWFPYILTVIITENFALIVLLVPCCVQEIDELLGQNLTQQDEDAIAEELESILVVRQTLYTNTVCIITYQLAAHQRHELVALSASPSNRFSATPYTYVLTRLCPSSSGNIENIQNGSTR